MDGEWGDYIALLGLVNMLDIPVAVVSSLGEEGLHIIYPSKHSQKEADFDSIALVGHEAESHFHSLQQMDAVTDGCSRGIKIEVWRRENNRRSNLPKMRGKA